MLNNNQFRSQIIKPVLMGMGLWSQEAEDLLVGTCAHESKGGTYLVEICPEELIPAVGIYQMERSTHDDIWNTFLPYQPKLTHDLMQVCQMSTKPVSSMLLYNLYYATAMARIYYLRVDEALPKTLPDQAAYYKQYWNTKNGGATVKEYIDDYTAFIGKVPSSKVK